MTDEHLSASIRESATIARAGEKLSLANQLELPLLLSHKRARCKPWTKRGCTCACEDCQANNHPETKPGAKPSEGRT